LQAEAERKEQNKSNLNNSSLSPELVSTHAVIDSINITSDIIVTITEEEPSDTDIYLNQNAKILSKSNQLSYNVTSEKRIRSEVIVKSKINPSNAFGADNSLTTPLLPKKDPSESIVEQKQCCCCVQ